MDRPTVVHMKIFDSWEGLGLGDGVGGGSGPGVGGTRGWQV